MLLSSVPSDPLAERSKVLEMQPSRCCVQIGPSSSSPRSPRPSTPGRSSHPSKAHCRDPSPTRHISIYHHAGTPPSLLTRLSDGSNSPAACCPSCSATSRSSSRPQTRARASPPDRACSLCCAHPWDRSRCGSVAGPPCSGRARRRGIEERCAVARYQSIALRLRTGVDLETETYLIARLVDCVRAHVALSRHVCSLGCKIDGLLCLILLCEEVISITQSKSKTQESERHEIKPSKTFAGLLHHDIICPFFSHATLTSHFAITIQMRQQRVPCSETPIRLSSRVRDV